MTAKADHVQCYGGLEVEWFVSNNASNRAVCTKLIHIQDTTPGNFVASLVRQSYHKDIEFKQSVLDALSPFQILSRRWASNAYLWLWAQFPMKKVYYFGSWFGMQGAFDALRIGYKDDQTSRYYFDLDKTALVVSETAHRDNGTHNNSSWGHTDVWDLNPASLDAGSLVVWTGIEHFEPNRILNFISRAHPTIRWLLQGTNMPADDHTNLVHSVEDLSKYFNTEPLLQGEMKTPIGSRFMAVF